MRLSFGFLFLVGEDSEVCSFSMFALGRPRRSTGWSGWGARASCDNFSSGAFRFCPDFFGGGGSSSLELSHDDSDGEAGFWALLSPFFSLPKWGNKFLLWAEVIGVGLLSVVTVSDAHQDLGFFTFSLPIVLCRKMNPTPAFLASFHKTKYVEFKCILSNEEWILV